MKADVVYLDPPFDEDVSTTGKYCLFRHIRPPIREILKKALSISKNIVISLPASIDIADLAVLFSDVFENNLRTTGVLTDRFSIEIEKIFINEKLERYLIYYGDCCSVKKKKI